MANITLYYDVSVNKYGVICGTSLRFWENKGWINEIDPYGWFQWYFRYWLGRRSSDDERQINRWNGIISRFRDKLVKTIKDAGSKFDDYSILPKIRQILLHWDYKLTEKDYYHFNKRKYYKKQKRDILKKETAEYYSKNNEATKETSKNRSKNLSKEEKDKIKKYQINISATDSVEKRSFTK